MAPPTLELIINGETRSVAAGTLADVVAAEGFATARVATALNGDFVPATKREGTVLAPGDRIEIVSARQGG